MKKTIKIGNASGFWGDEPLALKQQLSGGPLDYVVSDYLAEVSMSILSKQQAKNPELGYILDFIDHLALAKEFLHLPVKIVTNAGGNNPKACAKAIAAKLKEWGISKRVFTVSGDNIFPDMNTLQENGNSFSHFETGASFETIRGSVTAANAYTDSEGIRRALEMGADIVITGRASDSALAIGPLRYEFGWKQTDVNLLAAGMIAGHIIECGTQATGGNFTDWQSVTSLETIGFPIIEMFPDGLFFVTKHHQTGGMVTVNTVKEQLVYEIGNPKKYMGPDVIADITNLEMTQADNDKVKVTGCKGYLPPSTWKVSMAHADGFKATGSLMLSGPDALEKAKKLEEIFWKKLGVTFKKHATQFIGYNACHLEAAEHITPNEILVQFVAFDDNKANLDKFSRQVAAMILTGPQGLAATGGRPKIQEVVRYWPTLVNKADLEFRLFEIDKITLEAIEKESFTPAIFSTQDSETVEKDINEPLKSWVFSEVFKKVKMKQLCLARSGDKGNTVNIGVIARSPIIYEYLAEYVTSEFIAHKFSSLCKGKVERFEMVNLHAFNFFLHDALDGGGTYSGRIDPQGKAFASALLNMELEVPEEILIKS